MNRLASSSEEPVPKNVLLLYRRDANSRDFSDFRGCGQWQRRSDVALAFSNICDKIDVDLRTWLDEAGLFESYLRSQLINNLQAFPLVPNPVEPHVQTATFCGFVFGLSCAITICTTFEFACCRAFELALPYTFNPTDDLQVPPV
jgi:hypothetical protein